MNVVIVTIYDAADNENTYIAGITSETDTNAQEVQRMICRVVDAKGSSADEFCSTLLPLEKSGDSELESCRIW